MNRKEIKEAFGEDIDIIPRGKSKTTYYIEHEKKLKPRTENTPNNIGTSEKIMEIAIGHGNRVYKNPLQFAIAVKGFENWCIEKNVAPSYAGLAYFLNISKDTLIKYTHDRTEYVCYNLVDNETGEYVYSTNDKKKLDKYIDSNYLVEGEIKTLNVKLPALDINGKSNFDYDYGVGFSTEYFLDLKENMDDISWRAIYMQEPIEREGLLYSEDDFQYFFDLPKEKPSTIIAVCDSKGQGKDYVCSPCGYVYGNKVYINEVVFNNGLPEITKPMVANLCVKNKVSIMDIESNNGGDYYAKEVDEQIKNQGGNTSIRTFFTSSNKITKIITESDFVKKNFIFLHKSKQNTEYKRFMQNLLSFTVTGKAKYDDAPDAIAMLSQLFKELSMLSVKFIDRKSLPF